MDSISPADAIRQVLQQMEASTTLEEISPGAVVRQLAEKGCRVSPQHVSNIKAQMKKRAAPQDLPASVLKKVKALVDELGSVDLVRRALDDLEELGSIP